MKTSTKTVISINNISKVYEGPPPVRALDGVSLEVEEGDFVAIVGPVSYTHLTLPTNREV